MHEKENNKKDDNSDLMPERTMSESADAVSSEVEEGARVASEATEEVVNMIVETGLRGPKSPSADSPAADT